QKMKVIKQYEDGKTSTAFLMIFSSPIPLYQQYLKILKDKEHIKEAVKSLALMKSTIITKKRGDPVAQMEKMLTVWLEDYRQKKVNVMLSEVQRKVKSLFNMLIQLAGEGYNQEFIASDGWFRRFRQRCQIHLVVMKKVQETSLVS
ncbi:hypothetical protein OTU49_001173, partial [Cherax quadricarinatus]